MNSDKCSPCSRCVSDRVGVMFVGSIELIQGLGCLGLVIDWNHILTAFSFIIAGVCAMDGILRRNMTSVLANIILSVAGIVLIIAGIIEAVINLDADSTRKMTFKTIFLNPRSIFLVAALVDIFFLFYVYNFYKKLREEKKQEQDCTRILF